jgi:hypothetical protein
LKKDIKAVHRCWQLVSNFGLIVQTAHLDMLWPLRTLLLPCSPTVPTVCMRAIDIGTDEGTSILLNFARYLP